MIRIENNIIIVQVDGNTYNEEVLYKCFYWYTNSFDVEINKESDLFYKITLAPKGVCPEIEELVSRIKKDLIDYKLRDIVSKETRIIRELITAKAFAYFEPEENPTTIASDPIGFNPESI